MSGAALVRGELMAPAFVLSAVAALPIAAAAILAGHQVTAFFGGGMSRASLALAAMLVAASLIVTQIVIHNGVALLLPAWVRIGDRRGGGMEMMGQSMVVMLGAVFVMVLAVIPAAMAGAMAALIIGLVLSTVPVVLPAAAFAAVLLAECLIATVVLGRVLDRMDIGSLDPQA